MGAACPSQSAQNNLADGSMLDMHVLAFEPTQSQGEPSRAASNTLRFAAAAHERGIPHSKTERAG
jgi:hypothetical protein